MKANPMNKFHHLTSSNYEYIKIYINELVINSTKCEKLFGLMIDSKLNFNSRINATFKKSGQEISALSRTNPFMELPKRRLFMNAFFMS